MPLDFCIGFKIKEFAESSNTSIPISLAMRYGNPSIKAGLSNLVDLGVDQVLVIPLYPQYAAATTATVCDEVYRSLMKMRWQPSLQIIPHYESEPLYINCLLYTSDAADE